MGVAKALNKSYITIEYVVADFLDCALQQPLLEHLKIILAMQSS